MKKYVAFVLVLLLAISSFPSCPATNIHAMPHMIAVNYESQIRL